MGYAGFTYHHTHMAFDTKDLWVLYVFCIVFLYTFMFPYTQVFGKTPTNNRLLNSRKLGFFSCKSITLQRIG